MFSLPASLPPLPPVPDALLPMLEFLQQGGPVIWALAALSVLTVALILWKWLDLLFLGAWTGHRRARRAVDLWQAGKPAEALTRLGRRGGLRARVARAAMTAIRDPQMSEPAAREETERTARAALRDAAGGLRALDLIATIAPLLGLLGTVLGMIAAFQTLQDAGSDPDPAALAGGIWEALLTTAGGMAVAIPASVAGTWFESVVDRLRHQSEDIATRIFIRQPPLILSAQHAVSPAAPRTTPAADPADPTPLADRSDATQPVRPSRPAQLAPRPTE